MRFELFVASRYLRAKRRQAVIGVITGISIAGVAAGVGVGNGVGLGVGVAGGVGRGVGIGPAGQPAERPKAVLQMVPALAMKRLTISTLRSIIFRYDIYLILTVGENCQVR